MDKRNLRAIALQQKVLGSSRKLLRPLQACTCNNFAVVCVSVGGKQKKSMCHSADNKCRKLSLNRQSHKGCIWDSFPTLFVCVLSACICSDAAICSRNSGRAQNTLLLFHCWVACSMHATVLLLLLLLMPLPLMPAQTPKNQKPKTHHML